MRYNSICLRYRFNGAQIQGLKLLQLWVYYLSLMIQFQGIIKHKGISSSGPPSMGRVSSSTGSSVRKRLLNSKHFTEIARLNDALKMYTNLEEESGGDDGSHRIRVIAGLNQEVLGNLQSNTIVGKESQLNKNIFARVQAVLMRKVFQANYLLLEHQPINVLSYHIILILQFLQILYFVFSQVDVTNEFTLLSSTGGNTTVSTSNAPIDYSTLIVTYTLGNYFEFINFQIYPLDVGDTAQFLTIYFIMNGAFILYTIIVLWLSESYFQTMKTQAGGLKEGSHIIIKIMAAFMTLFTTVFQIPIMELNLQGYMCNEDLNNSYVLDIQCGSGWNQLLIAASTIFLAIYLSVLIFQRQLYTSRCFATTIPWGSNERTLDYVKIFFNFVVSVTFIFDKGQKVFGYTHFILSVIAAYIIYYRAKSAINFNQSIYYVNIIYETQISWLFLCVGCQYIANDPITTTSLLSMTFFGIFICVSLILVIKRKELGNISKNIDKVETAQELEIYYLHFYQLIAKAKSGDPRAQIQLQGIIANHLCACTEQESCDCNHIAETLYGIGKFKRIQRVEQEKARLKDLQFDSKSSFLNTINVNPEVSQGTRRLELESDFKSFCSNTVERLKNREDLSILAASQQIRNRRAFSVFQQISNNEDAKVSYNFSFTQKQDQNSNKKIPLQSTSSINEIPVKVQAKLWGQTNVKIREEESKSQDEVTEKSFQPKQEEEKLGIAKVHPTPDDQLVMEDFDSMFQIKLEKVSQQWDKFLSLMIQKGTLDFPKSVELNMIKSFVFKDLLHNQFKSAFEIMKSELCSPSLPDRFTIFQWKIDIEKALISSNDQNSKMVGNIDIMQVYKYEKQYSHYCLLEYVTANSALCFWRELLQKTINAKAMQQRGAEISRNYAKIQETSKQILKIYPNEIRFLHRYGLFLKNIVNNEYDALCQFEKASRIYQQKVLSKGATVPINEQTLFGENTASSIIVIGATPTRIGTILHANQEIFHLLGYPSEHVLNKNISVMLPRPLSQSHDNLIRRYLDTANSRVINKQMVKFALTSTGYIKHVRLLLKVYPHLNDKIVFTGFIQQNSHFDEIKPPKQEYEQLGQEYIMTDPNGIITGVSEGLNVELGLNSKFFSSREANDNTMIHISTIIPDLADSDMQDQLEGDGAVISIDTTTLLELIELEKLSSEEVLDIKSKVGVNSAYIQARSYQIDQICSFRVYRICLLPNDNYGVVQLQNARKNSEKHSEQENTREENANIPDSIQLDSDFIIPSQAAPKEIGEMGSVSSLSSAANSFTRIVQDFKKAIGKRKTPRSLNVLNRVLIAIMIALLVLTCIEYYFKVNQIAQINIESQILIQSESRYIYLVSIASNIRSLVNIANGLEANYYEGGQLEQIFRYDYLTSLISNQADSLQGTQNYLTQQRSGSNYVAYQHDQSLFEYQMIPLYQLDEASQIYSFQLPYRMAMDTYLNNIQLLNQSLSTDLQLPQELIKGTPSNDQNKQKVQRATSDIQKGVEFILLNGLRSIREVTIEAKYNQYKIEDKSDNMQYTFLGIMVIGAAIGFISICTVVYQIWATELNKAEILSLYAMLKLTEIKQVYDLCDKYIDCVMQDGGPDYQILLEDSNIISEHMPAVQNRLEPPSNRQNEDQMSEEEKEEQDFKLFIIRKRQQRKKQVLRAPQDIKKDLSPLLLGKERYGNLIRQIMRLVKEIQIKNSIQDKQAQLQSSINQAVHDRFQIDEFESTERGLIGQANNDIPPIKRRKGYPQENSSDSRSEEEIKDAQGKINRKNTSVLASQKKNLGQEAIQKEFDLQEQGLEQRRKLFLKTIRSKNWRFISLNTVVGLIFVSYFIYVYCYLLLQDVAFTDLRNSTPTFFERYSSIILAYSFMRERVINNGSLTSYFQNGSIYSPEDIDDFYFQRALTVESQINNFKLSSPLVIAPLISFVEKTDSKDLCTSIIGQYQGQVIQQVVVTKAMQKKLQVIRREAYQNLLDTVIAACNAASSDDLPSLQLLFKNGVDLNIGDYDKRTPLHVATGAGHYDIAQWLVDEAKVNVSPVDRWGATPLCDALPHPDIKALLLAHGAILGKIQPPYEPFQVEVTDDEYRLFYAAFFGDTAMMDNLRLLGWKVNGQDYDGRTPLGVAASQGNLEAVKYLVLKGADLSIKDGRGNDPLGDAKRENRTSTIAYLSSIVDQSLIRSYCLTFENGLLSKGIEQSLGIFQKKFTDLQIQINQSTPSSNIKQLFLLNITNDTNSTNSSSVQLPIPMFTSTHELYLHTIFEQFIMTITNTFSNFATSYSQTSQILFIVFICLQMLILFYLRMKLIEVMKEDVFQSRGILNLIPESFFEENRMAAERLIKKLKD